MKQEIFERTGEARWQALARALAQLDAGARVAGFPRLYRVVCQDLVLARDRRYDVALVERLNALALRGHEHLYGARPVETGFVDLFLRRFPRSVRREWRLALAMTLLFYGSLGLVFALTQRSPDLVYSIIDPGEAASFVSMYDPENHTAASRSAGEGVGMFFFYLGNNLSVDIRTIAGGILFGVGSLFVVVFNGVVMGAVAGHVVNAGFGSTFWPFVIGHASFELSAAVLSGVVGVRMGLALVVTGQRSRADALREATRRTIPLLLGAAALTAFAAIIESLWSGQPAIPPRVRYAAGALLWAVVIAWFAFGGRRGQRA